MFIILCFDLGMCWYIQSRFFFLLQMYSERAFIFGVYQSALVQADRGNSPIWLYNFGYKGQHSYGDYFATTTDDINFKWGKLVRYRLWNQILQTLDHFQEFAIATIWFICSKLRRCFQNCRILTIWKWGIRWSRYGPILLVVGE